MPRLMQIADVGRGKMNEILIWQLQCRQNHKNRPARAIDETDLTWRRSTNFQNHFKELIKRRFAILPHMIRKSAPMRLIAIKPQHACGSKIQRLDTTLKIDRKSSDRSMIKEMLELLQLLVQQRNFRIRSHMFDPIGQSSVGKWFF